MLQTQLKQRENNTMQKPVTRGKKPKQVLLTRDQKNFNRLFKQIKDFDAWMNKEEEKLESFLTEYNNNIAPLAGETRDEEIKLCHLLDKKRNTVKVSNSLNTKLDQVIREMLYEALQLENLDEATDELFSKYHGNSVAAYREDEKKMANMHLAEMLKLEYGVEFEPARLQELMENGTIGEKFEEQVAVQMGITPERKKQREEELAEGQKLKLELVKNINQSLIDSVNIHAGNNRMPQKVYDDLIREANNYYQNGDLPSLLSLEMNWVRFKGESVSPAATAALPLTLKLLKEQLEETKVRRQIFVTKPKYMYISGICDFSLADGLGTLEEERQGLEDDLSNLRKNISLLQKGNRDYAVIRDCIEQYWRDPLEGLGWRG